ncbi:MAG TPA: enoyl-CoA hydratase-related protein, partial [Bryobacteraceae bacterium]|nr:enoyl-CoA hydratase-related protein [Bryobacteraceae bacterium]
TMGYNHIQFARGDDGVAVLTLNRPARLNALNAELMEELEAALDEMEALPPECGLIVTGAGDKAFAAGADLSEIASAGFDAFRLAARGQRIFRRLELAPYPSVAAINGYALGGGLELAMACTLRVAATNAKLGQPEVKIGLMCGYAGTQRLPRLIGRGRALELLLTGDQIEAAEAHRIGLVNNVVPPEELLPFSRALLSRIAANGRTAVALTLQAVDVGLNSGLDEGSRFEAASFGLAAATDDAQGRIRSFLEKRR